MVDDVFITEEREQAKQAQSEAQVQVDKQRRINYGLTFSTREGFDVLADLMAFCHVNAISYGRGDQCETAFREGERNVFLYILSQLSGELKSKLIGG